jgi:hypothetical protein
MIRVFVPINPNVIAYTNQPREVTYPDYHVDWRFEQIFMEQFKLHLCGVFLILMMRAERRRASVNSTIPTT